MARHRGTGRDAVAGVTDGPAFVAVSAKRDGFRRAGRAWTVAPRTVAVDDLAPGQLAALEADPSLTVAPVEAPSADAGGPASVPPEAAPSRAETIRRAIGGLEPGREDHWTKSGRPEVAALRAATGLADVGAAERDAAWAAFVAAE